MASNETITIKKEPMDFDLLNSANTSKNKNPITYEVDELFQCDNCIEMFNDHKIYKQHLKSCIKSCGIKREINVEEDEGYKSNNYSENISQKIHKSFSCTKCSKKFCYRSSFTSHLKSHYIDEYPHKCTKCGARFKLRSRFSQHKVRHLMLDEDP